MKPILLCLALLVGCDRTPTCIETVRLLGGTVLDWYRCYPPSRMTVERLEGVKILVRCTCGPADGGAQ